MITSNLSNNSIIELVQKSKKKIIELEQSVIFKEDYKVELPIKALDQTKKEIHERAMEYMDMSHKLFCKSINSYIEGLQGPTKPFLDNYTIRGVKVFISERLEKIQEHDAKIAHLHPQIQGFTNTGSVLSEKKIQEYKYDIIFSRQIIKCSVYMNDVLFDLHHS